MPEEVEGWVARHIVSSLLMAGDQNHNALRYRLIEARKHVLAPLKYFVVNCVTQLLTYSAFRKPMLSTKRLPDAKNRVLNP